ncbi:MAG: hypothetical protein JST00_11430 [Deltaproteobacteria bacterium]|nr:hypothetical protein [Deltaproteobacteria bacterium]
MKRPAAYRAFQVVYTLILLNFFVPACSYIVAPAMTVDTLDRVNRALGGGAYPFLESSRVWHMLGVGNVMTLAFMCGLLLLDLRRFFPVLPALAFLKAFSAVYATVIGATSPSAPVFLAIGVLDGSTTVAMIVFAVRGRRALLDAGDDGPSGPRPLVRLLLPGYAQIERSLERVRAAKIVDVTPTADDVARGVLRMVHRLVFRSETIGTCRAHRVRSTWRARLLQFRVIRFPFLLLERAIAPLDLSGLASPPDRVIRHVLAAHHDGVQVAYDLELLALWPGKLEALRDALTAVVREDSPRHRWLRDLVVFDGYHEQTLSLVEACLRGEPILDAEEAQDPDLSLAAYLAWCARAAASPAQPVDRPSLGVPPPSLGACQNS